MNITVIGMSKKIISRKSGVSVAVDILKMVLKMFGIFKSMAAIDTLNNRQSSVHFCEIKIITIGMA